MTNKMTYPVADAMLRRLVWDSSMPCTTATEIMEIIGMVGQSEDVEEMEHRASHLRVDRLAPLAVPVAVLAAGMATLNANVAVHLGEKAGMDLGDNAAQLLAEGYSSLIVTSTVAIIAQLVDAGLLTVTGKQWT